MLTKQSPPLPLRLVILISGRGSNMAALIDNAQRPDFPAVVVGVISNNPSAAGLEIARGQGIATQIIDHKLYASKPAFEEALTEAILSHAPDMVCLAGFMRVLGPTYFERVQVPTLNVHPSLLPRHKGLDTHKAALEAGDSVHGCSVHLVTPDLDAGAVIVQKQVPILSDDTPESLAARVLVQEHIAYSEAVRIMAGRLSGEG